MKTHLPLFASLVMFGSLVVAADTAPKTFTVGAFSFERPEGWGWVPVTSPMRKAQLKVPGDAPAKTAADITFFHFGEGQGGDVNMNIARWTGQFKAEDGTVKPEIASQDVAGTKITFVKTAGTFSSGMPGGPLTPLTGYALRGAILESEGGNVFVKMTGPAATVVAIEKEFIDFVSKAAATKGAGS